MNEAASAPIQPIRLALPSARAALTARVKMLAGEHGLTVSAITTADAFPGLAEFLEAHITAGRTAGLDWYPGTGALLGRPAEPPPNGPLDPVGRCRVLVSRSWQAG